MGLVLFLGACDLHSSTCHAACSATATPILRVAVIEAIPSALEESSVLASRLGYRQLPVRAPPCVDSVRPLFY